MLEKLCLVPPWMTLASLYLCSPSNQGAPSKSTFFPLQMPPRSPHFFHSRCSLYSPFLPLQVFPSSCFSFHYRFPLQPPFLPLQMLPFKPTFFLEPGFGNRSESSQCGVGVLLFIAYHSSLTYRTFTLYMSKVRDFF